MEQAIAGSLVSILKILGALLLVALNALFVAAEFAFVKVRPTRISQLAAQGDRRALRTEQCITHIDAYLSVSQLGITLASLGLGWMGEPAIASLLSPLFLSWGLSAPALVHSISFVIAFLIITFLHVVFGELAPKSLAIQKSESLALSLAAPMQFFYYLFYPGVVVLNGTANKVLLLFGLEPDPAHTGSHSEEELRMLISASYKGGQIKKSEQELLQNVFKFEKKVAEEIMVPRPQVVFLDVNDSLEDNLKIARQAKHTRFPICSGSPDRVLGLIHIKDLLYADDNIDSITELKRDILFVPEGMLLDKLLQEFQKSHQHMAVVVDEYGGTAGIVTMDNILEELVGDIQDEFDQEEPEIKLLADGTLLVSGSLDIDAAIEELGLPVNDIPNDFNTLAGYVLGQLGRFPETGESFTLGKYQIKITKMDNKKIEQLMLIPRPSNHDEETS
ncbi:FAD-binding, type 2 [Syntrophomonas zehnderi OL-4]|uniref:FAD-binding, type 2 n=1 Tax=Syntrophomonas zehnderi OL-4 TaxID=690567 RepID=A0A0E3W3Q6_9FIRM|nr:hemolysin family protein [Syntrophomonas zehnderi]CFX98563.1 FAD-binding, type 2 [Syntrophomonas zehnderi OL-4]